MERYFGTSDLSEASPAVREAGVDRLHPDLGLEGGLQELLKLSSEKRCAIMCAEAVWWRCHRRIIADYLLLHGNAVFHLMGPRRAEAAAMTRGAMPAGEFLTYPASGQSPRFVDGIARGSEG
jgi:hypothetical protein